MGAGCAAALAAFGIATTAGAVTVETTSFISSPAHFNGFEGWNGTDSSYTEGGITVSDAWQSPSVLPNAPQGITDWYEASGGSGYTDVTLSDKSDFSSIQFLVGSGWSSTATNIVLNYTLLDHGSVVQYGVAGPVDAYLDGYRYYGFSGGNFNEIRLRVTSDYLDHTTDAGAYDAFAIGSSPGGVPEPTTWAMMILGFLGLGAVLRAHGHKDQELTTLGA
jgi:hypothetical protein